MKNYLQDIETMWKKIKEKKLWFLIITLLVISTLIYLEYFTSVSLLPSYFNYAPCEGTKVLGFSDYIKEAKWNGDELIIKSVVEINCCTERLEGKYNVEGDNLILDIKGGFCLAYAMCVCSHDTEFKIDNLEKKNYKIVLRVHDREEDYLYLKPDNSISDYCDDNRTYNCYKNYKYPAPTVEKKEEKEEVIINFEKPEYEEIVNKYSQFLEFIKKSESLFEKCDILKISFNEKFKTIDLRGYKDGFEKGMSRIQKGDNFEDAVKRYIARKEKEYLAESSLVKELQERLNLPIIYVSPNKLSFKFIYKGEEIQYSKSSLEFKDRKVSIDFRFVEETPEIQEITLKELEELIELSDKAFKYINENEKIRKNSTIFVDINRSTQEADFWAYVNVDESEAKYKIIIHNYELPLTEPVQKHYILNLKTGEL